MPSPRGLKSVASAIPADSKRGPRSSIHGLPGQQLQVSMSAPVHAFWTRSRRAVSSRRKPGPAEGFEGCASFHERRRLTGAIGEKNHNEISECGTCVTAPLLSALRAGVTGEPEKAATSATPALEETAPLALARA